MDTETTHQQRGDGRLTVVALDSEPARRTAGGPILPLSQAAGEQDGRPRRSAVLRLALQALA